jgi:hypothetical protein
MTLGASPPRLSEVDQRVALLGRQCTPRTGVGLLSCVLGRRAGCSVGVLKAPPRGGKNGGGDMQIRRLKWTSASNSTLQLSKSQKNGGEGGATDFARLQDERNGALQWRNISAPPLAKPEKPAGEHFNFSTSQTGEAARRLFQLSNFARRENHHGNIAISQLLRSERPQSSDPPKSQKVIYAEGG